MKREGTIGAAAFLAIAAAVGFSLQSGSRHQGSSLVDQSSATRQLKPSLIRSEAQKLRPGCSILQEEIKGFVEVKDLILPDQCYESGDMPRKEPQDLTDKTSYLKFVIALLPDPVHTHLSLLFDQFAVVIQEGAQDEKYDFDGSWLPWDDQDSQYARLSDEKTSNLETKLKEEQPGIILFRKSADCPEKAQKVRNDSKEESGALSKPDALSRPYREGLIVFVVGEEATQGIHREQFRNALAWIAALQPKPKSRIKHVAILGPTFSGSLPSLAQVFSEPQTTDQLDLPGAADDRLAIYSGSVSSKSSAQAFNKMLSSRIRFHSFVQNDNEILSRFCTYITYEQRGFDASRLAIISEDETAYGGPSGINLGKEESEQDGQGSKNDENACPDHALTLYYPRDISALRGAYQTRSLFDTGASPQPADTQRRNLPTDLADPSGRVHDSIRSYGGNQTSLTQEAYLLEIVAALRELHARYILLRSSNTLDQLFLTNFLHRNYPDGRIVIFGSDLLFIRERGATGLGGTMTLSTYPLFPLERDWTEHQSLPASDRVFSSDTAEGTYIAFRLLLNDNRLIDKNPAGKSYDPHCTVSDKDDKGEYAIFVPAISCTQDPPIPDYSPPFWTQPDQCGEMNASSTGTSCPYPGPAIWLSVIGTNRFWPMASLTRAEQDDPSPLPDQRTTGRMENRKKEPGGRPEVPLEMKVFLSILIVFSLFHALCCWSGSYTAKPAFRAHFASTGDGSHTLLIFGGSCCVAFMAIVAGWGCGVFWTSAPGLAYPWSALLSMSFVCAMAWAGIFAYSRNTRELSRDLPSGSDLPRITDKDFTLWNYRAAGLFAAALLMFYLSFAVFLQPAFLPENRVLTYWRAMHLASGVSPIVPILSILIGLYLSFWFTLQGLALFGPDRPCLPPKKRLFLKDKAGKDRDFLRMFSQEDSAANVERAAMPLTWKVLGIGSLFSGVFLVTSWAIARGVPIRSLGAERYAIVFLAGLAFCCSLSIIVAWRLTSLWEELRQLLTFLDRLPLRRTLAVLHGFSWGSVWKMSGNVLEVRYKVISRQLECMNHSIATLQEFLKNPSDPADVPAAAKSLSALLAMRRAGMSFADWYSKNYSIPRAGNLTSFRKFQRIVAAASGVLFAELLVPAWRKEKESLVAAPFRASEDKEGAAPNKLRQAKDEHIRNAEEFVCLNYLGFIQNILGRLRTMAITSVILFLASTVAVSIYPFDPRQALSAVLILLFVISGAVIVKVYADMHRDATLSHVTNTKPGELGSEFWFKIIGFGFAPLIGLLSRIFPSITDFVFSWLQPGISSLK